MTEPPKLPREGDEGFIGPLRYNPFREKRLAMEAEMERRKQARRRPMCPGPPGPEPCPYDDEKVPGSGYCLLCRRKVQRKANRKAYRRRMANEGRTVITPNDLAEGAADERLMQHCVENRLPLPKEWFYDNPNLAKVVPPECVPIEISDPDAAKADAPEPKMAKDNAPKTDVMTFEDWAEYDKYRKAQTHYAPIPEPLQTMPTEEWVDGEYQPLRLGPPPTTPEEPDA